MDVHNTVTGFHEACRRAAKPLGLVPTMGSIHDGHRALLQRARSENETVAATIFVNPTQFTQSGDYEAYPRSLDADLEVFRREGVDIAFTPEVGEIYPEGFDTRVDVGRIAKRLEGAHRPGHFEGVATVVSKLLSIARPDRAYFGEKDAQQCLVIRRLNADLDLSAEIVVIPTVREPDGLALSSRNVHLGPEERNAATVLYRAICNAERVWENGESDAETIRAGMLSLLADEPMASVDYVSVADARTLDELDTVDRPALVTLAVSIGSVRLIDATNLKGDRTT